MKKFMIIPLVFFNMSTCMFKRLQALKEKIPSAKAIKSITTTAYKKITTPKYSHPPTAIYNRQRALSACLPDRTTTTDDSIKSFTDSFKKIMPPPTKYVTEAEMRKAQNAQQNEINKIRIQDAIISVALFTLPKIDFSWIFQTVKNFFNPKEQLNEA